MPGLVTFPPGTTSLSFNASATAPSAVDVTYLIMHPPGVTFANGSTRESLPNQPVGTGLTPIAKNVQFRFTGAIPSVPIRVAGTVQERGPGGSSFPVSWVAPVQITPASFAASLTSEAVALPATAGPDGRADLLAAIRRLCELLPVAETALQDSLTSYVPDGANITTGGAPERKPAGASVTTGLTRLPTARTKSKRARGSGAARGSRKK